jgi:hypothetical protein
MADVTPFVSAFLAISVIVIVGKNKLPRWARFTLMATQAILIFFATALVILG